MRAFPVVDGLARRYAAGGLRVFTVHSWRDGSDDARTTVAAAASSLGLHHPTFLDFEDGFLHSLGEGGVPRFFVIGRSGRLRFVARGSLADFAGLRRELDQAIRRELSRPRRVTSRAP